VLWKKTALADGVVPWFALLAALVSPAYAQAPDEVDAPPETTGTIPVAIEAEQDPAITQLDDIVVTATKRRASLRDIPASIWALEGEELEAMGAFEMRDYLRGIPGVGLTELLTDVSRISIRGIQLDAGANTTAATGVFIDDIPLNDPFLNQARPDLWTFDLDGIEVLKGPQGTLFGGSALAGAVRYKLADALPGEWEFKSFGQYQDVAEGSPRRLAGVAANLPIGERGALRVTGVQRVAGGIIDDVRNGVPDTDHSENSSGRAVLRWDFSEAVSVRLKAVQQETRTNDLPVAENVDGRLERERALRPASPSHTEFEVYALDLDWQMSWADFASRSSGVYKLANYSNTNAERTLATEDSGRPADSPVTADIEGLVQEFRLASPAGPTARWQWLAGVYGHEYASLTTQQLFTRSPLLGEKIVLLDFVADVSARELAVFAELSRRLGERWNVTVGARGYSIETEGTVVSTGAIILATGSPENRNDAAIKADGINPKAALQFSMSEHASAYLSAARGFRFGGIQIVGPSPTSPDVPPTYSPDSLWSYELGVRTRWLDETLQADAAVFHIDWEDPQVNTITSGAVPLNVIDNVDGARSQGGEVALRYLTPIPQLELDLAAAYTYARTTAPFTAAGGATVPAGARLPGSPESQIFGALRYGWSVAAVRLDATLAHGVQGKGVSDILQSLEIYDYSSTDARLALTASGWLGAPRLTFGVTNLTDERAVVSALVVAPDNYTTVYNRPRTYEARLDLRF
jgi:iron complex outermembrane recepter protein